MNGQSPCDRRQAGGRAVALHSLERQRLNQVARIQPRAVLGVVAYWLHSAELEGRSRVDS